MLLTTKARYAIMAVMDMASRENYSVPVSLADIANAQLIKISYLEQLFAKLKNQGILVAEKGPGGGYLFVRHPREIALLEVIKAVEENLKMTKCGKIECCDVPGKKCSSHYLWKGLEKVIEKYFADISIEDAVTSWEKKIILSGINA